MVMGCCHENAPPSGGLQKDDRRSGTSEMSAIESFSIGMGSAINEVMLQSRVGCMGLDY